MAKKEWSIWNWMAEKHEPPMRIKRRGRRNHEVTETSCRPQQKTTVLAPFLWHQGLGSHLSLWMVNKDLGGRLIAERDNAFKMPRAVYWKRKGMPKRWDTASRELRMAPQQRTQGGISKAACGMEISSPYAQALKMHSLDPSSSCHGPANRLNTD